MPLVRFPRSRALRQAVPMTSGGGGKLGEEEIAKPDCVSGKDLGLIHRGSGITLWHSPSRARARRCTRVPSSACRPPRGHPAQPEQPPKGRGDGYCSGGRALRPGGCAVPPAAGFYFFHTGLIY